MRFEGDRDRLSSPLLCPLNDLADHMQVGAVNPIKIPHRQNRWAKIGRDFFEFSKNLHASVSDFQLPISNYKSAIGQISNSSFIPSYDNRACGGKDALVASCGRS